MWSGKFRNGVTPVEDTPCRVVIPESVAAVVDEIAKILNVSHGSAHHVVHDVFQFHKVSARWVPWQLTSELKQHVDACEELV
jgi:hypothetical protein